MRYVDTSVMVSLLTEETTSERVISWLREQPAMSLAASPWLIVELSSSLARKVRMQRATTAERDRMLAYFSRSVQPALRMLALNEAVFRDAARIADMHEAGIRAGDALHLAVAAANDLALVTTDKPFAAGAAGIGYDVELLA